VKTSRHAVAVRLLTEGLLAYVDAHEYEYEIPVARDYVLGPHVLDIVRSLRGLLNGEIGPLDAGSMDRCLCDIGRAAGFEGNEL
jgi:hypothetical protein